MLCMDECVFDVMHLAPELLSYFQRAVAESSQLFRMKAWTLVNSCDGSHYPPNIHD